MISSSLLHPPPAICTPLPASAPPVPAAAAHLPGPVDRSAASAARSRARGPWRGKGPWKHGYFKRKTFGKIDENHLEMNMLVGKPSINGGFSIAVFSISFAGWDQKWQP